MKVTLCAEGIALQKALFGDDVDIVEQGLQQFGQGMIFLAKRCHEGGPLLLRQAQQLIEVRTYFLPLFLSYLCHRGDQRIDKTERRNAGRETKADNIFADASLALSNLIRIPFGLQC